VSIRLAPRGRGRRKSPVFPSSVVSPFSPGRDAIAARFRPADRGVVVLVPFRRPFVSFRSRVCRYKELIAGLSPQLKATVVARDCAWIGETVPYFKVWSQSLTIVCDTIVCDKGFALSLGQVAQD
jgi:hypothetical protein